MIIRFYRKNVCSFCPFIWNKIHSKKYDAIFCDIIIQRKTCFSPIFYVGKIKQFNFLFESQFTSFGQILFNLYNFQMVEDFLGHPVYVAFKNCFTVNAYNLVTQVYFTTKWHCMISHATLCSHMFTSIFLLVLF